MDYQIIYDEWVLEDSDYEDADTIDSQDSYDNWYQNESTEDEDEEEDPETGWNFYYNK